MILVAVVLCSSVCGDGCQFLDLWERQQQPDGQLDAMLAKPLGCFLFHLGIKSSSMLCSSRTSAEQNCSAGNHITLNIEIPLTI